MSSTTTDNTIHDHTKSSLIDSPAASLDPSVSLPPTSVPIKHSSVLNGIPTQDIFTPPISIPNSIAHILDGPSPASSPPPTAIDSPPPRDDHDEHHLFDHTTLELSSPIHTSPSLSPSFPPPAKKLKISPPSPPTDPNVHVGVDIFTPSDSGHAIMDPVDFDGRSIRPLDDLHFNCTTLSPAAFTLPATLPCDNRMPDALPLSDTSTLPGGLSGISNTISGGLSGISNTLPGGLSGISNTLPVSSTSHTVSSTLHSTLSDSGPDTTSPPANLPVTAPITSHRPSALPDPSATALTSILPVMPSTNVVPAVLTDTTVSAQGGTLPATSVPVTLPATSVPVTLPATLSVNGPSLPISLPPPPMIMSRVSPVLTPDLPALALPTSPVPVASSPPPPATAPPTTRLPSPTLAPTGQHRMPGSAGNNTMASPRPFPQTSQQPTHALYNASPAVAPTVHPALPVSRGSTPDTSHPTPPSFATNRPITLMQHKHLMNAIRSTKRLKDAGPFLNPVDWKALNIPDYPHIVKNPVDLSVIEFKMQSKEYPSVDAISADFNLMVDNCVKYNGETSPYAAMAFAIRKSFFRHLEKLPAPDLAPPPPAAKKAPGSNARRHTNADKSSGSMSTASGAVSRKTVSPATSLLTTPAATGPSVRDRAEKLDVALSVVRDLFRKHHTEYASPFLTPVDRQAYPHYYEIIKTPMDFGTIRERLESGSYYSSVQAMEADAMQVFKNCFKFNPPGNPIRHAGMRLESVFKNLWAHRMAHVPQPSQSIPTPSSSVSVSSSSTTSTRPPAKKARTSKTAQRAPAAVATVPVDSASDSDDGDRVAIQSMERTIADLQRQLDGLKDRRRDRKRKRRDMRDALAAASSSVPAAAPVPVKQAPSSSGAPQSRRTNVRPNAKQPRRPANHQPLSAPALTSSNNINKTGGSSRPYSHQPNEAPAAQHRPVPNVEVTFDMKRELSERINDLPGDRLQKVLNIIQETMGAAVDGSEEIELDINLMDNRTVYRLWKLVTEPGGSAPAEPASPPANVAATSRHLAPQTKAEAAVPAAVAASQAPVPANNKFMSLSAALGPNSSDDDGSEDESSSGSDSD